MSSPALLRPSCPRLVALWCAALVVCVGCGDRWFEAGTLESAITNDQFTSWEKPSEWSQWRGGVLGGAVDERPLPTEWRAGEGLLWEVEIPGRGNSSPVVVG
ncbi:MAG: hypothetical protein R3C99_10375, partial [Pirellulaceae bacterium]